MDLAWFDPDPKKPPRRKVAAALARYEERGGAPPATTVLCNPVHAEDLRRPDAEHGLAVRAAAFVAPNTFSVGRASEGE